MSDLIERLQRDDGFGSYDLRKQAADEIEQLRAEIDEWKRQAASQSADAEAGEQRIAELESALREIHALYSDQGFTGLDEVLAQALKEGE